MRLLWVANAPWCPSGYGEQTSLFVPRLQQAGHELAIFANFGLQGAAMPWPTSQGTFLVYPGDGEWGNRAIQTYANHHQADWAIVLHDSWVLHPELWPDLRVAAWTPVDHWPLPPAIHASLAHDNIRPIAMSRFGERMMRDAGLEPLYVPHAVDRSVFFPQPQRRAEVREQLGLPVDAYVIGMVASNSGGSSHSRKGLDVAMHAFGRFAQNHDDAILYCHTQTDTPLGVGIRVDALAQMVCPPNRVSFPDPAVWQLGLSREIVALLYQTFDVLLAPSMGEGFGIPLLEAAACGIPVITSNHSSMPEVGQVGWLVEGDPKWDDAALSHFINPSIGSIVQALEQAYDQRENPLIAAAAVEHAATYDVDLVTEQYWLPALEQLAAHREVGPFPGAVFVTNLAEAAE